MPVDVRFRIAEAFVVHLPWFDDSGDGLGGEPHLVGEDARRIGGHQVELGRVEFCEQHAVAAIELLIAKNHVAALQLCDKISKRACLDAIDHRTDSASWSCHAGLAAGSSAATCTSLMLAPLSSCSTVWSL